MLTPDQHRRMRAHLHRQLYGESPIRRLARLARPWRWYVSDVPTLALIGAVLAVVLVLLTGCAPDDAGELVPEGQLAPLERDGGAAREHDCGAPSDPLVGVDLRTRRGAGIALSAPAGDTRIVFDQRTQLCASFCEKEDATPADPECEDAHTAHVIALCAGTCEVDP